ncbi:MAG: hypothetical protein ABW217_00905 [Polyangiaceae bacterium]
MRRSCCDDGVDRGMACVGAFRINDQCGIGEKRYVAGVPTILEDLREVSCEQSVDAMVADGVQSFLASASLECPVGPPDAGPVAPDSPLDAGTLEPDAASDASDGGQ